MRYRRNPDTRLRELERRYQASGAPEDWNAYYNAIVRSGGLPQYLDIVSIDPITEDVVMLSEALRKLNLKVNFEGSAGPITLPEPPPFRRAIGLIGLYNDNEYYVSPKGSYGQIGHSEAAMHQGVASNTIIQYYLLGGHTSLVPIQQKRVQSVAVQSLNKDGEATITEGTPSEMLSSQIRHDIGFSDPQIPEISMQHQPMMMYRILITDAEDIYRATLEIFHYLRSGNRYFDINADQYEINRLTPIVNQVLNYLPAYV